MTTQTTKLLIIGGGPAGYTAAIYAARANLEPMLALGFRPGGQLTITTEVENYPGFTEGIMGPDLMQAMYNQAVRFNTRALSISIASVDFSQRPFKCVGDNGIEYLADSVIIATGAEAKWLGIPGEDFFRGYGVSSCATCDGFFFRNRKVIMIGGGNTALEEALFMTKFASEITLIHRRNSFRGEKILQDRVLKHPQIKIMWDTVPLEILGETEPKKVKALKVKHLNSNQESILSADGIFVAIGHSPSTKPFVGQVAMDSGGYIITTPGTTRTSVPGVFAAGDVQDKVYRQAITAAGQGCMAALEAEAFLNTAT